MSFNTHPPHTYPQFSNLLSNHPLFKGFSNITNKIYWTTKNRPEQSPRRFIRFTVLQQVGETVEGSPQITKGAETVRCLKIMLRTRHYYLTSEDHGRLPERSSKDQNVLIPGIQLNGRREMSAKCLI